MALPESSEAWSLFADNVTWVRSLPQATRLWLADKLEPMRLAGGDTLFEANSAADGLFVLRSGSLGAYGPDGVMIGQIVAGETVGETGLITGSPRSATVRALRDSELWRLPREVFEELAAREPLALREIARLALARATSLTHSRPTLGPRTLSVLPQTEGVDAQAIARAMARALEQHGRVLIIDRALGSEQPLAWFTRVEAEHRFVIYVGDAQEGAWRDMCVRQADALIFAADARAEPASWSELLRGIVAPLPRPEHLLLMHGGKPRFGACRRWLKHRAKMRVHHVRHDGDLARVARLVTGKCMTLVLSGGGARGFAHIGVVRALREAGIAIDAVGGTSIGAIIGAGVAADWSIEEMTDAYRRAFVSTNPLSDRTFPFVSLVSGRKVSRLLRAAFGEREIEDLLLPFFCVSANLTDGRVVVHRQGPLWQWLRASVAIPGVLPPVFYHGQVLVDGGVINNLPVDVMRESQTGEVIAVDIAGDHAVAPGQGIEEFDLPSLTHMVRQWFNGMRRPSILQIMLRAGMVNSGTAALAARKASSLLIQPKLDSIDLLEWHAFDRAIDIGYRHTLHMIGASQEQLAAYTPLIEV